MPISLDRLRELEEEASAAAPAASTADVELVTEGGAAGLPVLVTEAAPLPRKPERAGFWRSFEKGLYAPPEDWGGEITPWQGTPQSEWGASETEIDALMRDQTFTPPEGHTPGPLPPEPRRIGDDTPNPVGFVENLGYNLGRDAPLLTAGVVAAPGLGAATGLGTGGTMALEGLAALGGTAASQAAAEAGAPLPLQILADVGTAMMMPALAPTVAPRITGRLMRAPDGALEASAEVVDYLARHGGEGAGLPPGTPPPELNDAYEASIQLKRELPRGVEEPGRFVDIAADRLDGVIEDFPDPNRRPSLAQALSGEGSEDIAGSSLVGNELRYSADDPAYRSAALGRRLETLEWAEAAYESESPKFAGYVKTRETAQTVLDEADAEAARLWRDVPLDDMPTVPSKPLVEAVEALKADIPGSRYLPREARSIEKLVEVYGDQIPYSQLQSLSSELSTTVRAGNAAGPVNEMAWRRRGRAAKLQELVEGLLDSADPGDVEKLRSARAATKRAKTLNTPIVQEIIGNADPVDVLNRIRRADDIGEEVWTLRSVLGEDGIAGLRAAAWEEIFGENLGARGVAAMRNTLKNRNNRQLYDALFEPEQLQIIRQNIDRRARSSYGRAATSGQPQGTGSGYQSNTEVLEALREMGSGRPLSARFIEGLRRGVRRMGAATPQSLSIEKLASQDIELARMLFRTPTPEDLPAMASIWRQALERAHRRAPGVFTTTTGVQAGARNASEAMAPDPNPEDLARLRALRGGNGE